MKAALIVLGIVVLAFGLYGLVELLFAQGRGPRVAQRTQKRLCAAIAP